MNNWVQQSQQHWKKMVQIRAELFEETFTNVELKQMNLTDQQAIIQKQKKRLNVKDKRITLQQLGLQAIENGENIYNLAKKRKIKIIEVDCSDQYSAKIRFEVYEPLKISIEKGTLLLPANDPNNKTQTLIVRDEIKAKMQAGKHCLDLNTFCYNKQLYAPSKEKYLIGSLRCLKYSTQMDQSQVWELTMKKRQQIEHFEGQLLKKDRLQYIAITKAKFNQMMNQWWTE